jgi:hypothetical protein
MHQKYEAAVKHDFKKYDVRERYDRICVLLRNGDFETLRAAHPAGGVSAWIRAAVSQHVDALLAKQRREARAARKALLTTLTDPNL